MQCRLALVRTKTTGQGNHA